jgi:hypothetical protein
MAEFRQQANRIRVKRTEFVHIVISSTSAAGNNPAAHWTFDVWSLENGSWKVAPACNRKC